MFILSNNSNSIDNDAQFIFVQTLVTTLCLLNKTKNTLGWRSANLFFRGLYSKYFRLCEMYGLSHNYLPFPAL